MITNNLKILHFASSLNGGANIAGRRLHEAMIRMGVNSLFYHGDGQGGGSSYRPFRQQLGLLNRNRSAIKSGIWARKWSKNGFVVGNRWIGKTPAPAMDGSNTVVCLHWVSRWLDLPSFLDSLPTNTPVVWTLHDLIPITGGCANPYTCGNYKQTCGFCPQLARPGKRDMSYKFQKEKAALFCDHSVHLVANSSWTAERAKESQLGKLARSITKINYGLNLAGYRPIDKEIARRSLSLPAMDRIVIGFACLDFNDERKGARKLLEALSLLPESIKRKVLLIVLGGGAWPAADCAVEMVSLGAMSDSRLQSIFYSSLDVFVLASSSETFGNVVIEAMACETSVIAFDCGGPRDTVKEGETGFLVPNMDYQSGMLKEKIQWMVEHPRECRQMGKNARKDVEDRFSDTLMAERYLDLFNAITQP